MEKIKDLQRKKIPKDPTRKVRNRIATVLGREATFEGV